MYNPLSEAARVAYGDLCYMKHNFPQMMVSSLIGPLLYLLAFGYGMRSGDSEYLAYVIPGIVAISSMNSGFSQSSQKIVIQRLFHTSFDELILSPMHTSSVILGKSLMGIVRGLIGGIVIILLGMLLTPGLFISIWFILALLISSLMFSILGVAAGLLAGSTPTLMMLNGLIILPMSFMCGTLFDVSALPGFAAAIIWALPLTHTSALLRAVATGGQVDPVGVLIIAAYTIAFFAICYVVIKKKLY